MNGCGFRTQFRFPFINGPSAGSTCTNLGSGILVFKVASCRSKSTLVENEKKSKSILKLDLTPLVILFFGTKLETNKTSFSES